MKMVAAAKLRRAQERMTNARPYAVMLASVLASLRRRIQSIDPATNEGRSPLLAVRPEKTVLLVVVSGDKGFAGAFSTNVVRAGTQFIEERRAKDSAVKLDVEAIGRKGRDFFRRRYPAATFGGASVDGRSVRTRAGNVEALATELSSHISLDRLQYDDVRLFGEEIAARYAAAEVDAVYLAYNSFKSVISQKVVVERILPLVEQKSGSFAEPEIAQTTEPTEEERKRTAEAALTAGLTLRDDEQETIRAQYEDESKRFGTENVDYLYDQPADEVYGSLLPRFVSSLLYHAMLESIASEHAARMTAMDAATTNASDMIDSLTLTMNRVRQAAITKEIIEIVSGAAAV